jgi:hypothetical protein
VWLARSCHCVACEFIDCVQVIVRPNVLARLRSNRASPTTFAAMAGTSWCVTFEDVADATAMKMKLENCVFWRKCSAASVQIVGVKLVFHFVSGIDRQEVQKKCAQTFKAYGNFKSFSIVAQTGSRSKLETLQKMGNISGNISGNFRKFMDGVCVGPWVNLPNMVSGLGQTEGLEV